jgi:cytochrome b
LTRPPAAHRLPDAAIAVAEIKSARLPTAATAVVWDLPVRIVHWAFVLLLGVSWYTAENGMLDWHSRSGYALLGLLLFRLMWGFIGSSTARFTEFVKGPKVIWQHLLSLRERKPNTGIGHNPLGAISVIALLGLMATQMITGLFAVDIDGIESGPLSDRVSFEQGRWLAEAHQTSFTLLLVLVASHLAAVGFYQFYKRDNIVGAMITGRHRTTSASLKPAAVWRSVLCAIVAICIAAFVANGLHL